MILTQLQRAQIQLQVMKQTAVNEEDREALEMVIGFIDDAINVYKADRDELLGLLDKQEGHIKSAMEGLSAYVS